jgi:hypothetical protein
MSVQISVFILRILAIIRTACSAALLAAELNAALSDVEFCCEALVRHGQMLMAAGVEEWPDGTVAGRYAFLHALYVEILYGRLAPGSRVELHRRLGERPKYQAPCREHPQTASAIENTQIHANHLEAFNASLRRRCAAYRRKTNTYAKKKKRLQQRLDVYWILHNFVRVHFTTKHVPAVALGIIEQGLSLAEIFSIPCVWN